MVLGTDKQGSVKLCLLYICVSSSAENATPRCVKCLTFLRHLKYTELKVIGFWCIHINIVADLFTDIFTNYLLLPLTNGCRGALPDAVPRQAAVRSQFSHAK